MLRVLEVTLPVFALVFCGYLGQHRRLLPKHAVEGLNAFVFYFALPAMLLRIVASQPVENLSDTRFALGFTLTGLIVFFATRRATLATSPAADGAPGLQARCRATAFGLHTSHGNVGYLGVALVSELGSRYLPTLILAIVCDIAVLLVLTIALMEFERHPDGQGARAAATAVLRVLLGSPLVLAIAAGLVCSITSTRLPAVADSFVRILSGAAGPCALVAIGASLGERPISLDRTVQWLVFAKLVAHPVLAAVVLILVVRASPQAAAIGVLAASLPGASNSFIIAQRYGVDGQEISAAILAGTVAGLATVSLAIWALGLAPG